MKRGFCRSCQPLWVHFSAIVQPKRLKKGEVEDKERKRKIIIFSLFLLLIGDPVVFFALRARQAESNAFAQSNGDLGILTTITVGSPLEEDCDSISNGTTVMN